MTTTRGAGNPAGDRLFPNWFYFNIYEISSWSRSILVPLAIIYAKKPFRKISPEQGIDELFVGGRANANLRLRFNRNALFSWRNFFLGWTGSCTGRRPPASAAAQAGVAPRGKMDAGAPGNVGRPGAIYPAMLNAIVALRLAGLRGGPSAGDPGPRRI